MFVVKATLLLGLLLNSLVLHAKSDWKPSFNDKPVPEKRLSAIRDALPQEMIVPVEESRCVLVFSATAGFRHASIPTGKLALSLMEANTGVYVVIISDDPDDFEIDALKEFDAVVLLSPTLDFFMPNNKQRKKF
jgi:hypothetical protein